MVANPVSCHTANLGWEETVRVKLRPERKIRHKRGTFRDHLAFVSSSSCGNGTCGALEAYAT